MKFSKIILIICISLLIIQGHYFFRFLPDIYVNEMRKILLIIMSSLGICGGGFLLKNKPNDFSSKLFSTYLLISGTLSVSALFYIYEKGDIIISDSLSPFMIFIILSFSFIAALYPIEILRPNWINNKRILLLFLPIPIITLIAYLLILYYGPIKRFDTIKLLFEDNPFYVLIRLLIFIYPTAQCVILWYLKKEYENWCLNNYVVTKEINVEWLEYYIIGIFGILTSYIYIMTVYSLKSYLFHDLLIILFSVIFYDRVYQHKNPYPKNHIFESEEIITTEINDLNNLDEEVDDVCFSDYKQILIKWFDEEKPYLKKDFRLMNLNEKIPLNRSYLSRFINDEFDSNFNNLITEYRLQESCRLINENPSMIIKEISDACGFSSPSVFSRSFVLKYNITPLKYRNKIKTTINN